MAKYTYTTTPEQEAGLLLALSNENRRRAAANEAALTVDELFQQRVESYLNVWLGKVAEADQLAVSAALRTTSIAKRAQIKAILGV